MNEKLDILLSTRIPDDLTQLNGLARDLDAYRYEAYRDMAEKDRIWTEQKNRYQMIKGPKTTESDRKFYTEFHTREFKEAYDLAYGRYKIINDKINLIQTLAKAETELFKRS
jgi:hypothetical protein